MNVSYNWLKEYIDFDESPEQIAEILTDLGLEIGGLEKKESVKGGLEGLVIGEVLSCEKHPDADKLKLTTVDVGGDLALNIVCGAPNVDKGQKVVVATIGTTLYSGEDSFKIKKSKIRGALSEGMLCAEDEIGLGTSHDGILNLPKEVSVGTLAKNYFNVTSDYILEIDITPNRADALSHIGVAKDLKAYFTFHKGEAELKLPEIKALPNSNNSLPVSIEIIDKNACPKYCGVSISGVTIAESPGWLKDKLNLIGLKPINNIVDVTNYVLMEMGQSLHAFDYSSLNGKIKVNKGQKGQKLRLLDGNEITLDSEDLVISNDSKPMCLAGVMGGLDSGVSNDTKNIFLEAAYFNPVDVRKSSKRHNTKTDSSYRFERGLDPNGTEQALQRAANLIVELAGGEIASELQTIQNKTFAPFEVKFKYSVCNKVIGAEIPKNEVNSILNALDIEINEITNDEVLLKVPQFRVDVQRESDVIEEVLRVYGYNNIAIPTAINSAIVYQEKLPQEKFQQIISDLLSQNGFNEILCNSLTKPEYYSDFEHFDQNKNVTLLNPLSSDLSLMRRTLLFGGLESIQRNQNMKNSDLKFYEIGKIYWKEGDKKYKEEKRMNLFLSGDNSQHHWNKDASKSNFFTLKGFIHLLLEKTGAKGIKFKASDNPFFSEGQNVLFKKQSLVEYGKLTSVIRKKFGIKQEVYYADINWDLFIDIARNSKVKYRELSKYHPVKRDLSLLLDKNISFKQLEHLALESERNLLKQVELFDVYEGDKLPENKKSYALSFQLQSSEGTLKDKEIDMVMNKLIGAFENKLDAKLR
ncbi:MAG: phenylalanyl-tRNA synthetase beta chain [Saprospiraceae bacterium]|jgi:phenylalanyl-tRNA synthetase beta chain